ncbi:MULTISPECIES: RNA polymerase sigma factor [unclassified Sphingobacterium]|uniref:RNA polymerase sigma factor n=1 Tax=unclassified Sphingobacterium TaxID=2609468 RepID=UPI001439264F|nr:MULTISPECIES: sigma-70 family RNA polymerase sigma factor [unclassified Sphingobacterium]MBB2950927.1 RNA polymerase sigma-70 factor (ECF subfamily) [Sphingobacterium sp. JUb56]NJI72567.1 sigma-70 family RNA polymerase sigma factor [Sphingobacterium sp. B16(2022)]
MYDIKDFSEEQKHKIAIMRDEYVFKEFFIKNLEILEEYALSIVKDDCHAEDVASEVFWEIWNMGPKLMEIKSVSAYLYRATKNKCLNLLRNKIVRYESVELHCNTLIDDLSPEALLISTEKTKEIEFAINQLSPKTKEAFLLVKDCQMTYKQAAESMGIAVKTVDRHMQIAIEKLYFLLKAKK